jgi:hypothetical protein
MKIVEFLKYLVLVKVKLRKNRGVEAISIRPQFLV